MSKKAKNPQETSRRVVVNKPSKVQFGKSKFLILDSPNDDNLPAYISAMSDFGVTDLVRTCSLNYSEEMVREGGIRTHEMLFPDGDAPPSMLIRQWVQLVNARAKDQGGIAVHCVAGLGRAPLLVTVALIEHGMDPLDAVLFIRERRQGAINRRQLQFLASYKRQPKPHSCCTFM